MSESDAELALSSIAADLITEITAARALEALELAAGLPGKPRELTPRQRDLADNHDRATPDRPGRPHCAYCGGTAGKLIPGPDEEFLGDKADHFCADERACIARRERRYPPDPSKVPSALMDLAGDADEAEASAAARQQAAQQQAVAGQAAAEQMASPRGWQPATPEGTLDEFGTWHPPLPPVRPMVPPAYGHTLMYAHNRSHLLSGQSRPHYYAGANYIPVAVYGSESHEDGQREASPAPAASEDELKRRGMYEAARGRGSLAGDIPMGHQAGTGAAVAVAAPRRPAGQRPPLDRYGRRYQTLKYRGRR